MLRIVERLCTGSSPRYIFTFSKPAGMPDIPVTFEATQENAVSGYIIDIFEGLTGICLPTGLWTGVQNIFTARMETALGTTQCSITVFPQSCSGGGHPF